MKITRSARDVARISHIIKVMFKNGLGYFVDELQMKYHLPFFQKLMKHKFREPESPEVRLRHAFEELGGTFIKLGQLLSLRPDLVTAKYSEELGKLQDHLPPLGKEAVAEIIRKELGEAHNRVFREFDFTPLASASIGQVHKARLKNDRKVAVKVMRPKVKGQIESDIDILYFFAQRIDKSRRYKFINATNIVKEFELYTMNELDYRKEAQFIQIFHNNFRNCSSVVIPRVYNKYTTANLLTMEYIEGVKVNEIKHSGIRFSKNAIISTGIKSMLKQIFEFNVFHADLHPGNLLILKNNKIALLDFGIIGIIDEKLKLESLKLLVALSSGDYDEIANVLLRVGSPSERTDRSLFRQEVGLIVSEWKGRSLEEEHPSHMMKQLFELCVRHEIKMPSSLILIGKAAVTLEATCKVIDPELDFAKEIGPHLKQCVRKELMPRNILSGLLKASLAVKQNLSTLPAKLSSVIDTLDKGKIKVDIDETEVRAITGEIGHSASRIALGMVLAALIISGTFTVNKSIPPSFFGYPLVAIMSYFLAAVTGIYFFFNEIRSR